MGLMKPFCGFIMMVIIYDSMHLSISIKFFQEKANVTALKFKLFKIVNNLKIELFNLIFK